ncbi:GntR family transcriptional regulator [Cupriavidus pinatubonensis]|uniref:GntR family transcriptional regulator n=1 Tax=Cupriavidus pinatubonensis TaxID=248026 RepID=UPI001C738430|nr:GntR family transcriptional regulator [Cupriavidus pinatubonensis]QYY30868.1 GntR family transcriptional regulator [Cupriavidus pinatubonensis]
MSTNSSSTREENLSQQAYNTIRRAIRDGKIARGQLFSENTLAESLGVSRTPVREALLNLYRDGVVDIVPKRGYRLAELDEDAISEIRLLRVALEQVVVSRLCEVGTPEGIQELRAILAGKGRTHQDMFTNDEAFHIRMAELAGLRQIRRELLSVRGKMYLMASGTRVTSLRNDDVMREHADIVNALERRDSEAARRAITEHVERSIDAFVAARERLVESQRIERIL